MIQINGRREKVASPPQITAATGLRDDSLLTTDEDDDDMGLGNNSKKKSRQYEEVADSESPEATPRSGTPLHSRTPATPSSILSSQTATPLFSQSSSRKGTPSLSHSSLSNLSHTTFTGLSAGRKTFNSNFQDNRSKVSQAFSLKTQNETDIYGHAIMTCNFHDRL